jgi:glycosyltransferase involved in cell wall biosynthesis
MKVLKHKPIVAYVPHGINPDMFFPIDRNHQEYANMEQIRAELYGDKNNEIEFILFFNSRNIRRKMIPDIILAFNTFCNELPEEYAKKCSLLLHTQPVDENGTNLLEVIKHLCPIYDVRFTKGITDTKILNYLYNIADVTVCIGSNEGWGLSCTESLMAGTPVIANVTGGLQDQMRFEDDDGNWIDFDAIISSNHTGLYQKHGRWAAPVFPSNRSIQGSVPTPYIFDDRVAFEDLAKAMQSWYSVSPDMREALGQLGREWVESSESRMSIKYLGAGATKCLDYLFDNWKPIKSLELINTKDYEFRPKYNGVLVK